jgi:stage V sporulation protein G
VEITEVRIKLMEEPGERLKAFCSITIDDCFVIRDLKIIDGSNGPFVAMPSRKLTSHCSKCSMKNHLRASFCNHCGARQIEPRMIKDGDGRAKLYADIAHPINSSCRDMIQGRVIDEYYEEIERAKQPGYVSRYDDFDLDFSDARSRPARFDQPHDYAISNSARAGGKAPISTGEALTPHSRRQGAGQPLRERAADGDFGAGIFPE